MFQVNEFSGVRCSECDSRNTSVDINLSPCDGNIRASVSFKCHNCENEITID